MNEHEMRESNHHALQRLVCTLDEVRGLLSDIRFLLEGAVSAPGDLSGVTADVQSATKSLQAAIDANSVLPTERKV